MQQPQSRISSFVEGNWASPDLKQLAQARIDPFVAEALVDWLSEVGLFVKDVYGRYLVVNLTLMQRCGCQRKSDVVGRTPLDVFPPELGARYAAQDQYVIQNGLAIYNQLELHLYINQEPVWCLTHKIPLFDRERHVIGLTGISRDLLMPDKDHPIYQQIADVIAYIQQHYAEPLKLEQLARMANLSVTQLERHMRRILNLTPKQLIIKTRLEAATRLLTGEHSIADIAYACGYTDHSAFSRQFKTAVGLSPTDYRELQHSKNE